MHDVLIVGGGIAGLSVAWELAQRGRRPTVLEAQPRPGGVILTETFDGFTIDAGPDALLIQKPAALNLCRELGIGDRLFPTLTPRAAFILRGGRLIPLPEASVLGIPTTVGPFLTTPLFSWAAKMRMGLELVIPARRGVADESIGSFMGRRFGQEAVTYLAEPLLAGIHAGDVNRLSMRAAFPRLLEAERTRGSVLRALSSLRSAAVGSRWRHRSGPRGTEPAPQPESRSRGNSPVFRRVSDTSGEFSRSGRPGGVSSRPAGAPVGQAGEQAPSGSANDKASAPPASEASSQEQGAFMSLPGGLEELVRTLVARLPPDTIRTGASVASIAGHGPFVVTLTSGEAIHARAVIVATPTWAAVPLLTPVAPDVADLVAQVRYVSSATIAVALRREQVRHPLQGSGYVVPRPERRTLMAASWVSSKWPHRAPEGMVLLRGFVGGAYDEGILNRTDDEIATAVFDELAALLGITGEPLFTRVYRWERASAQHEVGHLERMADIDRRLAARPGLYVTGSGFRGTGVPDCVSDGRATGARAATFLGERRVPSCAS